MSRVGAIGSHRQKAGLDKCFEHGLAQAPVDAAQTLNLFRPERQTRHFEVLSAYALQNIRRGRLIHGIPTL